MTEREEEWVEAAAESYDVVIDLLVDFLDCASRRDLPLNHLIFPLADFLTMIAHQDQGENGPSLVIDIVKDRIADIANGTFPSAPLRA